MHSLFCIEVMAAADFDKTVLQLLQENKTLQLLSKSKLFHHVKAQGIVVTKKAFDSWYDAWKSPVQELYTKNTKKFKHARIAAPPYSFMIDTIRMDKYKRQNGGKTRWLMLIEICSRKVWGYVLKSENVADVLDAYKKFLSDVKHDINFIKGDDYFGARQFKEFNNKKNIPVLTVVAKDEHVTRGGNPLGVLDSCVKTLRGLFEKHIHLHNDAKWTQWLGDVIRQYNNMPHSTHKNKTPNQIYGDLDAMC